MLLTVCHGARADWKTTPERLPHLQQGNGSFPFFGNSNSVRAQEGSQKGKLAENKYEISYCCFPNKANKWGRKSNKKKQMKMELSVLLTVFICIYIYVRIHRERQCPHLKNNSVLLVFLVLATTNSLVNCQETYINIRSLALLLKWAGSWKEFIFLVMRLVLFLSCTNPV